VNDPVNENVKIRIRWPGGRCGPSPRRVRALPGISSPRTGSWPAPLRWTSTGCSSRSRWQTWRAGSWPMRAAAENRRAAGCTAAAIGRSFGLSRTPATRIVRTGSDATQPGWAAALVI